MKSILLVAFLSTLVASQSISFDYQIAKIDVMTADDIKDFTEIFKSLWNGFLRGYYKEIKSDVIDENCLGEWIVNNLTELSVYGAKMANLELSYEEAQTAALDVVNIAYMNWDYCLFTKFVADNTEYFNEIDMGSDDYLYNVFMPSLQQNMFQIGSKAMDIFSMITHIDDEQTDEEILAIVDRLGEDYGAILSYLFGFNKEF